MTHDLADPSQARSQDTLRWGGVFGLDLPSASTQSALTAALQGANNKGGKQLVHAHWRWPLAWRVGLCVTPTGGQAFPGDLTITFKITFGSGDAQVDVFRTLTASNGQTDSTFDNALTLPACHIQIVPVGIGTDDSHPIAGPFGVDIGAFVAPETEPHAMLHMLECLGKMCGGADGAGQRQGGWMPMGFYEEQLGYRR